MADYDVDALLQGEDQEPFLDSPAEDQNMGSDSDFSKKRTEGQTPEEVEFGKLSGRTQDRIIKLIREKRDLQQELEKRQPLGNVPPPPMMDPNPDVEGAIRQLDKVGIATKDFVKNTILETLGTIKYQDNLSDLEKELSGQDGKPKFSREEYQDYVRDHPEYRDYLPRDVYQKMYSEELLDWEMSHRGGQRRQSSSSLKPTRTNQGRQELTPEEIENKLSSLKEPDRTRWYEANKALIDRVLQRTDPEADR